MPKKQAMSTNPLALAAHTQPSPFRGAWWHLHLDLLSIRGARLDHLTGRHLQLCQLSTRLKRLQLGMIYTMILVCNMGCGLYTVYIGIYHIDKTTSRKLELELGWVPVVFNRLDFHGGFEEFAQLSQLPEQAHCDLVACSKKKEHPKITGQEQFFQLY